MYALIVNILVTTLLFTVFKLFPRFGVRSKEAIIINYLFAAGFAWLAAGPFDAMEKLGSTATIGAAVVGLAFYYIFNKMSHRCCLLLTFAGHFVNMFCNLNRRCITNNVTN